MAEDQVGLRKDALREWAPWTKIFSGFKVALDPKKLLLAAGGILSLALAWWILAVVFWSMAGTRPEWSATMYPDAKSDEAPKRKAAWDYFKRDRAAWNKLYEMAGVPRVVPSSVAGEPAKTEPYTRDIGDFAEKPEEYAEAEIALAFLNAPDTKVAPTPRGLEIAHRVHDKPSYLPYGQLRVLPWFENRGPNPYLLVTGNVHDAAGNRVVPWQQAGFATWFLGEEGRVLLEPLVKFLRPVIYLFGPGIGLVNLVYLILVILSALAIWAFFGGAITRMAAVQLARPNERISLTDAVKFSCARWRSYFIAPVIPLVFLVLLTVVLWIFGLLVIIPILGDIVIAGLLWPVVLIFGLLMAVVLVGLVGWPLMYSTISAEGSDSFDAISRSYSYVYQAPWQYLWYSVVALVYGAALIFIGLMGSLTVYLGKWAVYQAPQFASREQSYLYEYAPTSFGWRDLLLQGSPNAVPKRVVGPDGTNTYHLGLSDEYAKTMAFNNQLGGWLVAAWLYLVFLLVIGFGYSYFWTASTIIYLLMRRIVDDTEMDEVHLEEEPEEPYPTAPSSTAVTKPAASPGPVMVDAPMLRTPEAPKTEIISPGQPSPAAPPGDTPGPAGI